MNKEKLQKILDSHAERLSFTGNDEGYSASASLKELIQYLISESESTKLSEQENEEPKESGEKVKLGGRSRTNKSVQKTGGVDLQRPL